MKKNKAIIVSGYFNPIHKGHLEYFNNAKALADKLIVIVNNDYQRELKGSKEFQKEDERMIIVSNMAVVDQAILSIDKDRTVCATLKMIAEKFQSDFELSFANGGDQNDDTIPERDICEQVGISLIDVLGDKIQSSKWLLAKEGKMKLNHFKVTRDPCLIIDVDDTITYHNSHENYASKEPNLEIIKKIKEYKDDGFKIILFSARNMLTFQGNINDIEQKTRPILERWLKKHHVPYDQLILGKPWCGVGGFYIDDKAIRPEEFIKKTYEEIKILIS